MTTSKHKSNTALSSSMPLSDSGHGGLKASETVTTHRMTPLMDGTDPDSHSSAASLKIKEKKVPETMLGDRPNNSTENFRFSTEPTLEDIRRLQTAFTNERGWGRYHQPRNLLLALVGEVGELAELFQWREEAPEGLPGWTAAERENLSDELSDVLIYLVALANKCHVDLPSAALRKIEKNRLKYPAEQVYGSSKKYTEYQK